MVTGDTATTTTSSSHDDKDAVDKEHTGGRLGSDKSMFGSGMGDGSETAILTGLADVFANLAQADEAQQGVIGDGQDAGIWVNGTGTVSAAPDLVDLNLGVLATGESVSAARQSAAAAMTAIVGYLTSNGVAEADIRTYNFSIHPRYSYQERLQDGIRSNERVLTGYEVANTVQVVVREMDRASELLDGIVVAGGDLVRVDWIEFRIEDASPLAKEAREKAVKDAMAKAQELASYAGVTLGRLVYLSELGGQPAFSERMDEAVFASADANASTPISPGVQQVQVTVKAVFALQ